MKSRTFARLGMAVAMVAALGATACDDPETQPPPVETITMQPSSLPLQVGQSGVIAVNVTGVTNPQISYTSSNNDVATVSGAGSTATVTAVGPGTASITATVAGTSLVGVTQVVVSQTGGGGPGGVTVDVSPPSATIGVGGTVNLFANVSGAANQAVTWQSQDPNVAQVDANGVVTGISQGTAVVVATSQADGTARGTATITVSAQGVNITIAPVNPSIEEGTTIQFSAVVSGAANTSVTWETSNPNVATIDAATGLAQGVSPGSTIISARSAANPGFVESTTLTVTPRAQANVSIASISDPTSNIQEDVTVSLNVDAPVGSGVKAVEVHLICPRGGTAVPGDSATVVGRQNVSAGTSGQIAFQINSAELDEFGNPRFVNQNCEFQALILNQQDQVIAQATNVPVTLANVSFLRADTVSTPRQAIGPNGFQWNGGTLTVVVHPVVFEQNTQVGRVSVTVSTDEGTVTKTDSTATDGFRFVFPEDQTVAQGGVGNVEDPNVVITATSVTAAGAQGPPASGSQTLASGFRLDNVAPTVTEAAIEANQTASPFQNRLAPGQTAQFWFNESFQFSEFIDMAGIVDGGVNRNTVQVFVADSTNATPGDRIPGDAVQVDSAGQLVATFGESTAANDFAAFVVVMDALQNADTIRVNNLGGVSNITFGVDTQDPSIQFAPESVADRAELAQADPTAEFVVEFQDVGSAGFRAQETAVQVLLVARDTAAATDACLSDATGGTTDTTSIASCPRVATDSRTQVDGDDIPDANTGNDPNNAYFTYNAFVEDVAGNRSNTVERTVLNDAIAPTAATDGSWDSTLDGGEAEAFSATLHDNLDIEAGRLQIDYPGAMSIGKVAQGFGTFGHDVFTTTATLTESFAFFVESIETNNGAGTPTGVIAEADQMTVVTADLPGNANTTTFDISAASTVPAGGSYNDELASWLISSSASNPSVIRAEALVTEDATGAAPNPFTRAELYFLAGDGAYRLADVDTSPLIADLGAQQRYAYEFAEGTLPNSASLTIVVLGMDANGRAVMTQTQVVDTR